MRAKSARWTRGSSGARRTAGLKAGAATLADAGRALLEFQQYPLAQELLQQALLQQRPQPQAQIPDLEPDLAIARAQTLAASGKLEDALAAFDQALLAAPRRPDFYRHAAALLTPPRKNTA